ncbi:MAG: Ldh family oxidoreductase [Muribaculaceae bacterium]|nr:Ldh family oxidoreductase [Muribaculaceae bacterium]
MADQKQVSIESLSKVVFDVLIKVGVSKEDSEIILDTILFANRRGVATHGVGRLPLYVHKIATGHYNPKNEIEVMANDAAYALLDAKNGFGQVVAFKATKMAIEKAKKYGIAVVGVRNSNNFGTAGYFGDMAAREGCAAMVYANAAPAIAPTGGNKTIFGTNPLCYAYPGDETHDPILLDMATTIAARGKIRMAAKNGEKIPLDWAIGPDGQPTDDPNVALKGSLLPIGGYKGYGLSMFVDIFAGMLTGSHFAGEVKNLSKMDEDSGNGHLFVVIDLDKFMTAEERKERIVRFYKAVKACGEEGKIFMPGEIEYNKQKKTGTTIYISNRQFEEVNAVAEEVGISSRLENE